MDEMAILSSNLKALTDGTVTSMFNAAQRGQREITKVIDMAAADGVFLNPNILTTVNLSFREAQVVASKCFHQADGETSEMTTCLDTINESIERLVETVKNSIDL